MGRASQIISFINSETIPDKLEMLFRYTHIEKTPELKELRKKVRKEKIHPVK